MIAAACAALAVLVLPRRPEVRAAPALGPTPGSVPATGAGAGSGEGPRERWPWAGLLSRRRRSRERSKVVDAVLDVLDVVAAALRAGQSPDDALRYAVAANSPGPWGPSAPAGDVVAEFERLARVHGIPALEHVTRAWRLAADMGAPLANAVDIGAALLRHARDHEHALAVAFAGPRATIRLLTVLPLGGPAVGVALGLDPVELYFGSPVGRGCIAIGLVLVLIGRTWCRRLLGRALGVGVT